MAKPTKVRRYLLAVRLNRREVKAYRAMCKAMKRKPSTQLREMIQRFAGVVA